LIYVAAAVAIIAVFDPPALFYYLRARRQAP
jgi:hypothetical protein